ncbi:MAG: flagellar protein export ATPase FliI [Sneathiellaceae bacterium]
MEPTGPLHEYATASAPALSPDAGGRGLDVLEALGRLHRGLVADDALIRRGGHVQEVSATHYRVGGLSTAARLGDIVEHRGRHGPKAGEVVQISADSVLVAPFDTTFDAGIADPVFLRGRFRIGPDVSWKGRVVDALGHPVDGGAPLVPDTGNPAMSVTPPALSRQRVDASFRTGVKVIDIFTPLCFGQRMGVFAGSGVGKSTLLAMLAAAQAFDTVVIALVGERGREVREFLEDTIGTESMKKTVAVVATSDESAMMRKRASGTAMSVAEYFRDRGDKVLLILDSVTRFAHALREVAIGAGEPPVARGYPASVFTDLPKLLERAGPGGEGAGSITAIISVLVDGDDHNDPVADSVRGILDGHVVLERAIAEQGRYPAVDPLASVSRLANRAWSDGERTLVTRLKAMISRFEETRDIRILGAYKPGGDGELDNAVRQVPAIYQALMQAPHDGAIADPFSELARHLKALEAADG